MFEYAWVKTIYAPEIPLNPLNYKSGNYYITFYPDIFEENPSLQLMSFGNPLFEEMLSAIALVANCS